MLQSREFEPLHELLQTDEGGSPILEWGHTVECLNKLDAGVSEQLMLLSRDEGSMLVVTYGDVAHCLAAAYQACTTTASLHMQLYA